MNKPGTDGKVRCSRCKRRKSPKKFSRRAEGYQSYCKPCMVEYRDEPEHKSKQRGHERRHNGTADGRQKVAARRAVRRAIKAGRLVRPTKCPEPGCQTPHEPIEACHDNGYTKPHWEDIVWRCRACHRARDMRNRTYNTKPRKARKK